MEPAGHCVACGEPSLAKVEGTGYVFVCRLCGFKAAIKIHEHPDPRRLAKL